MDCIKHNLRKKHNKLLLLQSRIYCLVLMFTYLDWMINLSLVDQIKDITKRKKEKKQQIQTE